MCRDRGGGQVNMAAAAHKPARQVLTKIHIPTPDGGALLQRQILLLVQGRRLRQRLRRGGERVVGRLDVLQLVGTLQLLLVVALRDDEEVGISQFLVPSSLRKQAFAGTLGAKSAGDSV